jgi:mRNA-degrading endonuclease RelE of RelBE toxin-antitoxin system
MIKEKTKTFAKDTFNAIEVAELVEAISPEIQVLGDRDKETGITTVRIRYPEEFENEIRDLVQNYVQTKTEEESLEENATTPTDRFKKLFIKTLQSLDAQERAQFKAFIEGL